MLAFISPWFLYAPIQWKLENTLLKRNRRSVAMKSVEGSQDGNRTSVHDPNAARMSSRRQEILGSARLQKQNPDLEGIAERMIVNVGMEPFMPRLSTAGRRRRPYMTDLCFERLRMRSNIASLIMTTYP